MYDMDSDEEEDNNFYLCLDNSDDKYFGKHKNEVPTRKSLNLPERPAFKPILPDINPSPYNLFRKSKNLDDIKLSPKHLTLVSVQKNELTCTENDDDDDIITSQEEKSEKIIYDIRNIGLFRKKMKNIKRKFSSKQKRAKDFESIINDNDYILERLDEDFQRYSMGAGARWSLNKYYGRFSGGLPSISERPEKNSIILNYLESNAKRLSYKKKTESCKGSKP